MPSKSKNNLKLQKTTHTQITKIILFNNNYQIKNRQLIKNSYSFHKSKKTYRYSLRDTDYHLSLHSFFTRLYHVDERNISLVSSPTNRYFKLLITYCVSLKWRKHLFF